MPFKFALLVLAIMSIASPCLAQQDAGQGERPLLEKFRKARAARQGKQEPAKAVPVNENMVVVHDVTFGKDPLQKLDVYAPKNAAALPVVLFVHGGGWRGGDKGQQAHQDKGSVFTENGIVLVNTNYRLSPKDKHPAHEEDVAAAYAWIKGNIKNNGGDSAKIYVMGHSSGAHLVDLLGTNKRFLEKYKLPLTDIKGVISLDTASLDLFDRTADKDEIGAGIMIKGMFESAFGHDSKVLTDASPTLSIKEGEHYPPFLMFCGERRKDAVLQHEKFAKALKSAGGTVEWQTVPLSHRAINLAESDKDSEVFKKTIDFIKDPSPSKSQKN